MSESATAVKERPIIFGAADVQAILGDRKTQTRRIAKPPAKAVFLPSDHWKSDPDEPGTAYLDDESGRLRISCPYGMPRERLWVREAWSPRMDVDARTDLTKAQRYLRYRADSDDLENEWHPYNGWRRSIHMPRWASRITLEITNVRVERLQEISSRDAWCEGARCSCMSPVPECKGNIKNFAELWDSIHGRASWNANSWVWVIGFRRIEP